MEYKGSFERRRNTVKAKTKNEKTKTTRDFCQPVYLSDAVKPLILLNSIINTGIIEFSTGSLKHKFGMVYIMIIVVLYCITFYNICKIHETEIEKKITPMGKLLLQIEFYCNVFTTFGTIIIGFLRSKAKVTKLVERIVVGVSMKCSEKNYEEAINTLRYINLLTGLRTFEHPRGHFRPMITISLVILVLIIGVCTAHKPIQEIYIKAPNKTEIILYSLLPYICVVLSLILIIVGSYQSKRFKEYVKRLSKVDKTLEALDSSTIHHNLRSKTYILLIVFSGYVIFLSYVSYMHRSVHASWPDALCRSIIYVYVMSLGPIVAMDFIICMRHVQSRFRKINLLLRSAASNLSSSIVTKVSFPDSKRKAFTSIRKYRKDRFNWSGKLIHSELDRVRTKTSRLYPQKSEHLLQTIRQIHLELSKLLMTLCDIFGTQISVELSISIFFVTVGSYVLYYIIINPDIIVENIWYLISLYVIYIMHIFKTFFINYVCDNAVCEANNTAEILHATYGTDPNRNIRDEMRQFDLQMMQCRYRNSASGLFIFSCKLICGCLGTVTTYVVIIIQMN